MRLFTTLAALATAAVAAIALPSLAQPGPSLTPTQPRQELAESPPPPTTPPGQPQLTRQDVEAWMDGYVPYALQRGDVAGAVVVVVKDGQVLMEKGYGYSDLKTRTPVDPQKTLFRPGSVSKLFTWTAVMQQVERGKINLDADINTYLPKDFQIPPRNGKPITMRHIMTHTPGFEEQIKNLLAADPKVSLEAHLKNWVPKRIFDPGTTPAYSNYATALAGYVVERVSGQNFNDYLDANIFRPLGMNSSSFRQPLPANLAANMSKGYETASGGEAKPYENVSLYPAGSLASTGDDMGKFMIAHLNGGAGLLKPETARLMHTTGYTVIPGVHRMLLGFYEQDHNGHRALGHGGDTQWFHSNLHLMPDDRVGVFISMNSAGRDGASGTIRSYLWEGFVDRYFPDARPAVPSIDAKTAKEHAQLIAGNYVSSRRADSSFLSFLELLGQPKVIANPDGTISIAMLTGASGQPKKWREVAPFVWEEVGGTARIAAEVKDGKVVRFTGDEVSPFMMFTKAGFAHDTSWMLPALIAALVILLLTALLWPITALVRRRYRGEFPLSGNEARAYRLVRIGSLLTVLVFAGWAGLVVAMFSEFSMLTAKTDPYIWILQILGVIVFFGTFLIAAWNAWLVWKGRRSWFAKLWSTLLVLASLMVLFVALNYHLIGFGVNY